MRLEIKILGTGCANCKKLENFVREVVHENSFDADINKIEDIIEIMKYGIRSTPGLVINGKIAISGRVPSKTEIKQQIEKTLYV